MIDLTGQRFGRLRVVDFASMGGPNVCGCVSVIVGQEQRCLPAICEAATRNHADASVWTA